MLLNPVQYNVYQCSMIECFDKLLFSWKARPVGEKNFCLGQSSSVYQKDIHTDNIILNYL